MSSLLNVPEGLFLFFLFCGPNANVFYEQRESPSQTAFPDISLYYNSFFFFLFLPPQTHCPSNLIISRTLKIPSHLSSAQGVCCTCLAYFNQRPDNSRPAALHVPEEGWKKRRDGYNKEKNDNGASLPSWGNVRYRQGEPPSSTLEYFPHISVRFFKYLNFEFTLNDSQLTNVTSFRDLWGLSTCILLRISVYQTKNR